MPGLFLSKAEKAAVAERQKIIVKLDKLHGKMKEFHDAGEPEKAWALQNEEFELMREWHRLTKEFNLPRFSEDYL